MNGSHRAPTVLVAGSIVIDTLVRPVPELRWGTTTFVDAPAQHLGGNGANTARALAILGARVSLLGAIGNDDAGRLALQTLNAAGVDTRFVSTKNAGTATSVVAVSPNADRLFLHHVGAGAMAFADGALPAQTEAEHLHVASLFVLPHLRKQAPVLLRQARERGMSTSLDVNWDAHGEWLRVLAPCLPHTDVLFLNEQESHMLTGTEDPVAAAHTLLSLGVRTVVQKLGAGGSTVVTTEAAPASADAFPVNAVDSTGAGDCFAGAFLVEFLRGAPLADCAAMGNAAGALAVSAVGSTGLLARGVDLQRWAQSQR